MASATAVPLADALGGWSASLLAWALLAALALLAWVPMARAARRHAVPDAQPADVSHALPWASLTAWLLAIFLAFQLWQFYSSLAWLAPTYESVGWSAREAGLLMAVFTGAQLVSGLLAPALLDHVGDARVLLVAATLLGGSGELGVWLAPEAAPWVWALLLGAGQGACFALGLALLVRYAATPRDSARLTAMAFLVSYTIASFGPATMGAVEDVTGRFAALWALLALVAVPQLVFAFQLRPGLPRVGDEDNDPGAGQDLRSLSWPCAPAGAGRPGRRSRGDPTASARRARPARRAAAGRAPGGGLVLVETSRDRLPSGPGRGRTRPGRRGRRTGDQRRRTSRSWHSTLSKDAARPKIRSRPTPAMATSLRATCATTWAASHSPAGGGPKPPLSASAKKAS